MIRTVCLESLRSVLLLRRSKRLPIEMQLLLLRRRSRLLLDYRCASAVRATERSSHNTLCAFASPHAQGPLNGSSVSPSTHTHDPAPRRLTRAVQPRCRPARDLVLGGAQAPDQKVSGHFPFTLHFDFTSFDYFKPLVFQGSAQGETHTRQQRSQVCNLRVGCKGKGDREAWGQGTHWGTQGTYGGGQDTQQGGAQGTHGGTQGTYGGGGASETPLHREEAGSSDILSRC